MESIPLETSTMCGLYKQVVFRLLLSVRNPASQPAVKILEEGTVVGRGVLAKKWTSAFLAA